MARKATAIPGGGGGGCWLGGPKTASSDNYGTRGGRTMTHNLHGTDLFGESVEKKHTSKLGDEFLIPPFTVLSAREGWWQDRKRAWLALGIQSELGRGEGDRACPGGSPMPGMGSRAGYSLPAQGAATGHAAPGGSLMPSTNYSKSKSRGDSRGRPIANN